MNIHHQKIAVVGAGLMGTGIAHAFLAGGYPTALIDVDQAALRKARLAIEEILAQGVKLGKMDENAVSSARERLTCSTDLARSAEGAQLLIETATESLQLKLDIISEVDGRIAGNAIIASNTSALSITEIAGAAADPGRVIGMHFFNPVQKMKLLELVRGLATTEATIERSRAFGASIGKETILVSDSPGLTTSRMSALSGNEAMYMLSEGVASAEDIDKALRLGFNHPMGPLELGDLTGWDTRLKVLHYLYSVFGEKFRPCPLIIKMVKSGRTGRKVGAGVYEYTDGVKVPGSGLRVQMA